MRLDLGPYAEEFRSYLMNTALFPSHAVVAVFVARNTDVRDMFVHTPARSAVKEYHHYELAIPGMKLTIGMGKLIPEEARHGCSFRSADGLVYLTHRMNRAAIAHLMKGARVGQRVKDEAEQFRLRYKTLF